MRWLRLHWNSFSSRKYTSEKELVSKSNVLKKHYQLGRHIVYMIFEYSRAKGAFEAVQRVSDMFTL